MHAGLLFDGPAYRGLDIPTLPPTQVEHAQKHVRFLSGLYGYLSPGDLIQEYRLEMGTKFTNGPCTSLYDFWGACVSRSINEELRTQQIVSPAITQKVVINIASAEYFKVIRRDELDADVAVVECVFKDNGRVISVHAKRARGLMARFIVEKGLWCGDDANMDLLR